MKDRRCRSSGLVTSFTGQIREGLSSWWLVPLVLNRRIPRVTSCWPHTSTRTWTASPRCQTTRAASSLQSHTLAACTCSPQRVRSCQYYNLCISLISSSAHQVARRSSSGCRRPRLTSLGWCSGGWTRSSWRLSRPGSSASSVTMSSSPAYQSSQSRSVLFTGIQVVI